MKSFERFGVTGEQLRALVAEGLRDGGDWCDLYFEDTSYHDLLLRDGVVGSGGYHVDYGCGIRVLKGEKTGYAYAETTDFPSLLSAARAAASIADTQRATASGTENIRAGIADPKNFALRAHPSQPDGWAPPVYEATGGHGFAGSTASGFAGRPVLILIGPEGDFSPEEAALARERGWIPVQLGPSRLRTETAAVTAVTAVYLANI